MVFYYNANDRAVEKNNLQWHILLTFIHDIVPENSSNLPYKYYSSAFNGQDTAGTGTYIPSHFDKNNLKWKGVTNKENISYNSKTKK